MDGELHRYTHVLALVERLLPRLLSAGIVFVLAALTGPFTVGTYSAVALAYTFVQATAETAVRQILPAVADDSRFLRRYAVFSALGSGSLLTAVVAVATATAWHRVGASCLWLEAIALVPLLNALALPAIGRLQLDGRWGVLARSQALGVAIGAACGLALMLFVQPLLGVGVFLPVAEAVNALAVRHAAARLESAGSRRGIVPRSELLGIAGVSGLSWMQGQADRVLLTIIAGPAALGSLSVGSSMARALGDPISGATSNLLRVKLTQDEGLRAARHSVDQVVPRSLLLAAGTAALVLAAAELIARPILGEKWSIAIDLVPVLTVAIFFSVLNAALGSLQVYQRKLRRALLIPGISLILAPVVAVVAATDLYAACWLIVAREAFVCSAIVLNTRASVSGPIYRLTVGCVLAAITAAVVLHAFGR